MSRTMTTEAVLHRKLVAGGFGRSAQGAVMRAYRESVQEATVADTSVNHTEDLAVMVRRLIVAIRKDAPEGSPARHTADVSWAYLIDKGLIGSPLRNSIKDEANANQSTSE